MTAEFPLPAQVQPAFDAIVKLTDAFCQANLTEEFQDMCRQLAGVLACKSPSPLLRSKPEVWACGILRVIGQVNFLDLDTGRQPLHEADDHRQATWRVIQHGAKQGEGDPGLAGNSVLRPQVDGAKFAAPRHPATDACVFAGFLRDHGPGGRGSRA